MALGGKTMASPKPLQSGGCWVKASLDGIFLSSRSSSRLGAAHSPLIGGRLCWALWSSFLCLSQSQDSNPLKLQTDRCPNIQTPCDLLWNGTMASLFMPMLCSVLLCIPLLRPTVNRTNYDTQVQVHILNQNVRLCVPLYFVMLSPRKIMQNHMEITSHSDF